MTPDKFNFSFLRKTAFLLSGVFCIALFVNTKTDSSSDKHTSTGLSGDTVYARKLFDKADMLSKTGKFDSAIIVYTQAGNIYQLHKQFVKYACCLNKISETNINSGKFDKGRKYAREALSVSLQKKDRTEEGGSYNNFGAICLNTGKFDSASFYFNRTLDILQRNQREKNVYVSDAYFNLAIVSLYKGESDESLRLIDKAISIAKSLKGNVDANLAAYYSSAGDIHLQKGDYSTGRTFYEKTISLWAPKYGEHHPVIGSAYNGMGVICQQTGNFSKARIYLSKAANIFEAINGPNDQNLATILLNLSMVQVKTKEISGALTSIKNVIRIYSMSEGLSIPLGQAYNIAGFIYNDKKQYDSAEFYYKKGIETIMRVTKTSELTCQICTNMGLMFLNLGRYEESQTCLNEAVDMFRSISGEKHPYMSSYYHNLGNLYFAKKNYKQALFCLQKAIASNVDCFTDTLGTSNPVIRNVNNKLALLYILEAKSDIFQVKYYQSPDSLQFLKTALANAELATQLADSMRTENNPEDTRNVIDVETLPYATAIEFAYLLYHRTGDPAYLDKAFLFSEKSRYSSLYSSMKELEARNIGGIPENMQAFERNVQANIAKCNKSLQDEKLSKKPDMKTVRTMERQQFSLMTTSDSLKKIFERNYPAYYHLRYDKQFVSISDVQKSLDDNEILLEYANTGPLLITFIISPYTVTMLSNRIDSNFNNNIGRFRNLILHKDIKDNAVSEFCSVAGYLYDKLIKKAEPLIRGKNLIIVPDGKLGTIPFEALVNGNCFSGKQSFKSLPYLVQSHSIGYGYSATIFLNALAMKNRHSGSGILAFAPSFKSGNKILLAELNERGTEYIDLAGAKEEVKNIQQQSGSKVFLDTAATKKNFLEYSPDYNILHISTHGIMNNTKPMESKLVFYQKNDSSDACLYAYELFNMKLNASLAVLSACNSGFGIVEDGEGIMSVATSFMYAGVPSVISTLWSVNDRSTAMIMKGFYQHLGEREEKPIALKNAQIEYIENADNLTAHPYYWAGFMAIGNINPVLGTNPLIKWGIAIAILGILFGISRFVKTRKKTYNASNTK